MAIANLKIYPCPFCSEWSSTHKDRVDHMTKKHSRKKKEAKKDQ